MRILDLFAGAGGRLRRKEIEDLGHEYITLDYDKTFNCTITKNIFDVLSIGDLGYFDFVWASVPCESFSVASIGHHWTGGKGAYIPKTENARISKRLVLHTLKLIHDANPPAWIIENPRGLLRKMSFMKSYPRYTISYCQYGDSRMKPTDLWGIIPRWIPRLICRNGLNCHEAAPRGSKTGTQGLTDASSRAIVPLELWLEIIAALDGNPKNTPSRTVFYQDFLLPPL